MKDRISLIGFGEAGSTFARCAKWQARAIAFDVSAMRDAVMADLGVPRAPGRSEALAGAALVLSLVTADQAVAAARECVASIAPGTLWCDMNSVAPQTKRAAAAVIENAGGNYVDVAVLAPVDSAGMAVPLLVSGEHAPAASAALVAAGFTNVRVVGNEVGRASAIKMIRSVMVKGIEALTDEMMAAAYAAGVVDEVLGSLDASEKSLPWATRTAYNIQRMTTHGLRRAAEMEESAKTLEALGIDPVMTRGTVLRQRAAAGKEHS